jgi:small subunit ribosomal protein S9
MSDQTPQDPQDEQETTTPDAGAEAQAEETTPTPEDAPAAAAKEMPAADEQPEAAAEAEAAPEVPQADAAPAADAEDAPDEDAEQEAPTPRVKPAIPGADLEVDIVLEGQDALGRERSPYEEDLVEEEEPAPAVEEVDQPDDQPIVAVDINLTAEARYRATGKRKTSVARVTLRPGTGAYTINGRPLEVFFPRPTLQRNIRQPLETVGYEARMDVIAKLHGGGVSAQAGALRHGISRALLEADPNLRGELKRRGFLTRDARAKERKKAGLKKARKRPQFSKR